MTDQPEPTADELFDWWDDEGPTGEPVPPDPAPGSAALLPFSRGVFSIHPRCPRCGEGHHTDRRHRPRRPWRKVEHYVCDCRVCGQKWKEAAPDGT